jgi:hypothetical protein
MRQLGGRSDPGQREEDPLAVVELQVRGAFRTAAMQLHEVDALRHLAERQQRRQRVRRRRRALGLVAADATGDRQWCS